MPYTKLSEYCAKKIYDKSWPIIQIKNDIETTNFIQENKNVVLKVDQFIKRRGKKGLIQTNTNLEKIKEFIKEKKEYSSFILEKQLPIKEEKYFCIKIENGQKQYIFNENGGIFCDDPYKNAIVTNDFSLFQNNEVLVKLDKMFDKIFANMLEVNPLIISDDDKYYPVDFAIEVDSCGINFWNNEDKILFENQPKENSSNSDTENQIKKLDESSGASLKFKILNPHGNIMTLVAGGGASVLYTDAIVNHGYGNQLYNYGEYSGNPSEDETYQYCSLIFKDWLQNCSENPVLFIGGGISNFTDVAKTFKGIIRAIKENAKLFQNKKVKIWVRRGGVNEKEGLTLIEKETKKLGLEITVKGTETPITAIIPEALPKIKISNPEIQEISFKPNITTKDINLWNENIIFVGNHTPIIQRIIDYDYYIGKDKTSITCIYDNFAKKNKEQIFYWGTERIIIPISSNIEFIKNLCNTSVSVYNYASIRSCVQITRTLCQIENVKTIYIIAEGLPEKTALELSQEFKDKTILGPSSVGAIKAGKFGCRIGSVGGLIDNIKRCNLSTPGNVAIITKSGGLLNEMINYVSSLGLAVGEAVSIGGDRYPGIKLADLMKYFLDNKQIQLIILLGETGGIGEIEAAEVFNHKKFVIAWCSGTSEKSFSESIEFGHAGASATNKYEEASIKNYLMAKKGFWVPDTFENIGQLILEAKMKINEIPETPGRTVPIDIPEAIKNGLVRTNPSFSTKITDERNDLKYRGEPVENIITKNFSIGYTIGSLWLNLKLENWSSNFIEKIIVLMADHGPAVSGAQNTIITARAGKNLTESLAAGILTIGPRFGGAVSQAAVDFFNSFLLKETAQEFVERIKKEGKYIMGIGHKIKSKFNPDKRVEIIKEIVLNNFPKYDLFKYTLEIEKETLNKKANLILNVDGAIAAALVDLLLFYKSTEETKKIINESDIFNGFFVFARTMGFIAHYQEQKVDNNSLYRVNPWEILYN